MRRYDLLLGLFLLFTIVASDNVVKMFAGREDVYPPICGYKPNPCSQPPKFRRLDASCTNPNVPHWGIAGDLYMYLIRPAEQKDEGNSARELRLNLFPDGPQLSDEHALLFMTFGQFMSHDNSMFAELNPSRCCTPGGNYQPKMSKSCMAIQINKKDPVYSSASIRCMNVSKAESDFRMGCTRNDYASPINTVTSPLDLSVVYGNNEMECNSLRAKSGGLLKTRIKNGVELLPITKIDGHCCEGFYLAGDSRSNQNLPLLAIHILFVKEHNRIVNKLSEINSCWDSERLFHEARKILIAQYQHIVYYHWLPIFLNRERLYERKILYNTRDFVEDFDPKASPAISVEYAHATSRKFHSMIPENIELYTKDRILLKSIPFPENFNCQDILERENVLEQVYMGLITQQASDFDIYQSKSVGQYFDIPNGEKLGKDLIAIDIQRCRDVRINPYVKYKNAFGFGKTKRFSDLTDLIDKKLVKQLKETHSNVDTIDLIVGGMLETDLPDSYLGPTLHYVAEEQFLRLRRSDYYFYESKNAGFTIDQLNNIRSVSNIGRMICDNVAGLEKIQENAFDFPSDKNELIPCEDLKDLDWSLWKE